MGCRLTKNDGSKSGNTEELQQREQQYNKKMDNKINYKSKLEYKMCMSKETPDEKYDLSDCNLDDVPSGVFIMCRVLRKEILDLSKNRLKSLNGGGLLNDLHLLKTLDLRYNKIKKLPDDICKLENLRELFISNNLLVKLPDTINSLKYLELLDISYNTNLNTITQINCMPRLKILNLKGNHNIKSLPITLCTCNNLNELILDIDHIEYPSKNILLNGTMNIMKFLQLQSSNSETVKQNNSNIEEIVNDNYDYLIDVRLDINNSEKEIKIINNDKSDINNALNYETKKSQGYDIIDTVTDSNKTNFSNKNNFEYNMDDENHLIQQLQTRQKKQKEELLQAVLNQQHETESLVNKIQKQKDNEKNKLIKDVLKDEFNTNQIIENLLKLKNETDNNLLEKEKVEEERLLEKLRLQHSELRKQEILSIMSDTLRNEEYKIQNYNDRKLTLSSNILEKELQTTTNLTKFLQKFEKNRNEIIQKICENEELQKQAVMNLISKNDARTWGLMEQLRIIEIQLAKLTQLEVKKKSISNTEYVDDLSKTRTHLTSVLVELLDQHEIRKKQLLNTIISMEAQNCDHQQDYWLLQYQRLLDTRPDFTIRTNSIEPLLGYNFLVNGVIHCLPFLQKLWQNDSNNSNSNNNNKKLENLTDNDLKLAGINKERDRKLILKSIKEYLRDNSEQLPSSSYNSMKNNYNENSNNEVMRNEFREPSAPPMPSSSWSLSSQYEGAVSAICDESFQKQTIATITSECVVCMDEQITVIFIPCGHMCCCLNCQDKVNNTCPMCRADIKSKIKIIQF